MKVDSGVRMCQSYAWLKIGLPEFTRGVGFMRLGKVVSDTTDVVGGAVDQADSVEVVESEIGPEGVGGGVLKDVAAERFA